MNKTMIRLGGVTAVLGSVYLLMLAGRQVFYGGNIEDYPLIAQTIALMSILLLLGAVGLLVLANGRRGVQAGTIIMALGSALMTVGFGLMFWFDNDNGWSIMYAAMIILPVGVLIFGIANRQAAILSHWNKLPLIMGALATILIFAVTLELFAAQQSDIFFSAYLLTLAIGWLGMGAAMVRGEREAGSGSVQNRHCAVEVGI